MWIPCCGRSAVLQNKKFGSLFLLTHPIRRGSRHHRDPRSAGKIWSFVRIGSETDQVRPVSRANSLVTYRSFNNCFYNRRRERHGNDRSPNCCGRVRLSFGMGAKMVHGRRNLHFLKLKCNFLGSPVVGLHQEFFPPEWRFMNIGPTFH